jgi:hypothetical protein
VEQENLHDYAQERFERAIFPVVLDAVLAEPAVGHDVETVRELRPALTTNRAATWLEERAQDVKLAWPEAAIPVTLGASTVALGVGGWSPVVIGGYVAVASVIAKIKDRASDAKRHDLRAAQNDLEVAELRANAADLTEAFQRLQAQVAELRAERPRQMEAKIGSPPSDVSYGCEDWS